ncbi:MAG: nucleoside-diphosphate kinase [Candidatus Omnitrophica bacterium CG11_big_fil_rev_8_21_14_0_20_45_26]|uniref:nucleoside-diphosphate kinase n=1 Tax=Candidatus Abzuiibacterium crystallinum TaxID=1974748 RepID=A0A2H0LN12_9BACT|nr:MAG: nucleoside-diphosphate kinase [Candidatus Omnitrophica bacterium CG11_big_fil_rev_8_21_14_0_20_45_26]PIW64213.1 MAG: nucleoside-diphosphate kinase [Candidatus Omnitrophica bacterium CG12_big_fil_rev_8_21_14_0_65_45_16]
MAIEQTLILIKPDGLAKSLTGNIITRLSEAKLEIAASKCIRVPRQLAENHYKSLQDKPFFEELIGYIQGKYHSRKKVLAMVYYGEGAIQKVRELSGKTNPEEADSISIRGQYGRITTKGVYENVIHASSSPEEAEREIKLWFQPDDIIFDIYPTKNITEQTTKKVWA